MAEVSWTEPALAQLDEIAEYIALENLPAVSRLVVRVFAAVDRLEQFPRSGRKPPELADSVYREIVVSPCRVFYRTENEQAFILYVMREERKLRACMLNNGVDS
ncbi:ParE toxin of type II toxin-antitoxin system, parDE [Modicisalibacter muralis]|uniref:ParE toxin of type II toxin-antitoxin system, parDE n=1 Tax=Modicisalibacter muralis TaxID=119000 RepID=A0A1G9QCZ5_9GAMM|nr:type II toxin-antitoxin system RelE/ParE family toxin [Halomonas muralis]SDM08611.1 ParE toxin of type II toxin-antitoxin system, parDE [Halomonas muralis]